MRLRPAVLALLVSALPSMVSAQSPGAASSGYLLPPKVIVDMLDAPPPPTAEVSPARPPTMQERFHGGRKERDRAYNAARAHEPHDRAIRSRRWQSVREIKLSMNPLCERCTAAGKLGVVAREVHHKVGRQTDLALMFDLSNLESLCVPCHRAEEASRRG